ncbi:MAG: polyprenyl synthetase family protein [Clostridiales bacterium]|nr:polyprenyl synthetase family protein [Clostridiales bacterium]
MYTYKTENFNNILKEKIDYIEEVISDYLPREEGEQKVIFEAMNYSVLGGGKRIRPMLMMETFLSFGGKDMDIVHSFMMAIEFIHSYSLVHDDLPAMDNDEYRRGKETTHVKFGETIGILAGDGLLNYAFETATGAYFKTADSQYKDRIIESLQVLGKKSGIYGMIGGQVIDTCILEGQTITDQNKKKLVEELNHMYTLKTGALIQASMMIGAILAGASKEEVALVEEMATNIGLAFQIQDDVLDVTSTTEQLGKPVLSDQRNEKITYVSLLGLDKAKEEVAYYSKKSLDIYKQLGISNPFLYDLINMLINRDK